MWIVVKMKNIKERGRTVFIIVNTNIIVQKKNRLDENTKITKVTPTRFTFYHRALGIKTNISAL
jgi:hypothetical protein